MKTKKISYQSDLRKEEFSNYFNALQSGLAVIAINAQTDELTSELNETYLYPLKIKSMFDVPLRENGVLVGVYAVRM